MDNLFLSKITYEFIQQGNTDGTTDETEELTVEVIGVMDILTSGGYMVLRTPTGWSINSSDELMELLKVVESGVNIKK